MAEESSLISSIDLRTHLFKKSTTTGEVPNGGKLGYEHVRLCLVMIVVDKVDLAMMVMMMTTVMVVVMMMMTTVVVMMMMTVMTAVMMRLIFN